MEEVIQPACARLGLAPVRVDSLTRAGEINEQIFRRLREDDVVIADLTGANANVMYELGLRHTRDKLTVQLGEFGRLPFDINMIRTIQFSPSPVGLLNARDELIQVLEAGIAGDYDPVTATRVWAGIANDTEAEEADESIPVVTQSEGTNTYADPRGFLDIMAEAEEKQETLVPALEAVGKCIVGLGDLAQTSATEIERSDAAGKGMRGRLQVTTKYAHGLDAIADELDALVDEYVSALNIVSDGTLALIGRMEEADQDRQDGEEYGMIVRQTAKATRESMEALAGMVDSMDDNARMSRVLREPSSRLTKSFDRFATTTSIMDEWDRRLQSLGVPVPPEGWQPSPDESQAGQIAKPETSIPDQDMHGSGHDDPIVDTGTPAT